MGGFFAFALYEEKFALHQMENVLQSIASVGTTAYKIVIVSGTFSVDITRNISSCLISVQLEADVMDPYPRLTYLCTSVLHTTIVNFSMPDNYTDVSLHDDLAGGFIFKRLTVGNCYFIYISS